MPDSNGAQQPVAAADHQRPSGSLAVEYTGSSPRSTTPAQPDRMTTRPGSSDLVQPALALGGVPAPRLAPVKARALKDWPAGEQVDCNHAGLLLLLLMPAIVELGLPDLIAASDYPSTTQLSAWHSLGALLAKCARVARVSHTTLTVIAGNLYRLLARQLPRYENATPDRPLAPLPQRHRHPPAHRHHDHDRPTPTHLPPRPH